MKYIYWPKVVGYDKNDARIVIALQVSGSDLIVISLLTPREAQLLHKGHRFVRVGHFDHNSDFVSELDEKDICIVEFWPPKLNLMQFYALEPISLALPEKADSTLLSRATGVYSSPKETFQMRESIDAINLYYKHLQSLRTLIHRAGPPNRGIPVCRITRAAADLCGLLPLFSTLRQALKYVIIFMHSCARLLSAVLNWTPPCLVSFSATAQQIDLRCQQFCYFPVQYLRITENAVFNRMRPRSELNVHNFKEKQETGRGSSSMGTFPCEYYLDYIRFYNTIWLIVNDVSFGLTVGTLLAENKLSIAKFINFHLTDYLFHKVHYITAYLGQNPLGIKLNGELAHFLSDLFLWIIDFSYSTYIKRILDVSSIQTVISIVSRTSCCFGVTFALSLAVDVVSILSMHISLFYYISAKMYHWQLHVMRSLLYLFWGKKRNVLRKRVDSNMFELDQLVMGTLFFTVMVFLLPTLAVFYISFTALRMTILIPELLLESLMALLNHFPLFVLLLRLKDPSRIPGGVSMRVLGSKNRFALRNNPLTVSSMFRPYSLLMGMMAENYCSVATLKQILVGQPITIKRYKMYQVLYSTLPKTPIATSKLWEALKESRLSQLSQING
ncbi:LAQU0S03e00430g1_1 [Lachancea quebecensis]|uniref:LAQU0S03e00430g1_1 n=1 Tax=Lachancea quebecensis TaxID=1654605 RepID=A0A0P1KYG5_9SACH|nr:LAQU0S03e00430g1_1 [Lachancea quebecensis]